MTTDRAGQDAFPFEGGGTYQPLPGMTIAEHARIQFIAAAISGMWANPSISPKNEKAIEVAIRSADYALKVGGYVE